MTFVTFLHGLRPIEVLLLTYLIPTTLLMVARRRYHPFFPRHLVIRLGSIAIIYGMRWLGLPTWLRDWYPVVGYLLFYEEVAVLNRLVTQRYFDKTVIGLEQRLFRGQPSMYVIEGLPHVWLSDYIYFCYLIYYAMTPIACFTLYGLGMHEAFRQFIFILMLTFHICFWIYIFFPVASPFYEFPRIGAPYSGRFFYRIIDQILVHGSSKGTAFPSSHVAIGIAILMGLAAFHLPMSIIFAPFVVGLVLATVYGRYHYALDSFAGIAVAVSGYATSRWLYGALQGLVA